jgi:RNA polymerase sigma factor (sigma-70 family)|tara:strand:+ start:2955 stop:3431 length:477 start_codon:yes stop_codon:yes gene_type:complete
MMDSVNQKFDEKWNDSNVRNIMNKVSNRYKNNIDFDDIESIQMNTLWRCIEKYDETRGTKFTSYLYQQLSYAFKNKIKKKRVEFNVDDFDKMDGNHINKLEVIDIINGLEPETANILEQRFYENMTMKEIGRRNGYSRETARRKLKNAIKTCKMICEF